MLPGDQRAEATFGYACSGESFGGLPGITLLLPLAAAAAVAGAGAAAAAAIAQLLGALGTAAGCAANAGAGLKMVTFRRSCCV